MLQLLGADAVRLALGLVLGAGLAAAIACAGAARPPAATSAVPPAPAAQGVRGSDDPRAEIDALDREIAAELVRAQIARPVAASCAGASCAEAMTEPYATPATTDPTCRPAASDKCKDVCTLSTSICKNQERICELAKQLPGDDWAANKCTSARASCQTAHDSCCSCVL